MPSGNRFAIWGFAFGYFACYIPYSVLTKSLSSGQLMSGTGAVSGFEMLPATAIATSFTLLLYMMLTGAWREFHRVTIRGRAIPMPRWQMLISGTATATIIATTTLNYTFEGISLLFALLLMRGGVLMLAPVVDRACGRPVYWYSWAAFALSLLAVTFALTNVNGYTLTLIAVLNLSAYMLGYIFRLNFMTRIAKKPSASENRLYFIEETFVAAVVLVAVPGLAAAVGFGEIGQQLRTGFTTFLLEPQVGPALAIGFCYACLYYFGSRIYLDQRENTFCIPLNRCSSLMSGVVSSWVLTLLMHQPLPSSYEFIGTAIIVAALLVLSVPSLSAPTRTLGAEVGERVLLFICSGNRSRSPMARMICEGEIAKRLERLATADGRRRFRVLSAGLTADPGQPLSTTAAQALEQVGESVRPHSTNNVTSEQVQQAELIFCMTDDQCRDLVKRFPQANAKTIRLDPRHDIADPAGQDLNTFVVCAQHLKAQVSMRLDELGLTTA
ncbi:MAG: hypothetical protein ABI614_10560 [Planctomycetota bacterium]